MSTVPPHRSPEDVATHTVDTIIYLLTVLLVWLVFIGRYVFAIAFIIGRRVYHLGSDPAFHQVMRQLGRRLSEIIIGVFDALRGHLATQQLYRTVTTETHSSPRPQPQEPAPIPPAPPVFLFSPSRPAENPVAPSASCSPEARCEQTRSPSPVPVASTSNAPPPTPAVPQYTNPNHVTDLESTLSPMDLIVPLGVSSTQLIGETGATLQPETGYPGQWYSVVVGYRVGVFQNWTGYVHDLVDRVPGNRSHGFNSRSEAVADFVAALRAGAVRVYPTLQQLAEMQTLAADLVGKKPGDEGAK